MKIYASYSTDYALDQFVGTDLWVKCIIIEDPDDPYYCWYRINSKDPVRNTYKVNFVADDWLQHDGECHCTRREYNSYTSEGIDVPVEYINSVVRVTEPPEVYTTDEFFVIEEDQHWGL